MTRTLRLGALAGLLTGALAIGVVVPPAAPTADAAVAHGAVGARVAFHDAMRKLWEDHIVWTRQFIVSAATESGNLPDIGPTTDRLLANQTDIGNALKPFYGEATGDQVTALLRDHILTAAQLVAAAKAGDQAAVASASAAWYANAHDIALALHGLNPDQWSLADLDAMMKDHLDLTLAEAVARLQGRYVDDVLAYDRVHAEILEMADMLSDGIVAQFPAKFGH
ncbi:MAG TPA: hypothetical protein VGQ02_11620 [Candidatus Limnocylindrales bacterium]|jgi:hypothetical protein|nr:hypothetical protein [Candidatus Limnocylindrales bacterium]